MGRNVYDRRSLRRNEFQRELQRSNASSFLRRARRRLRRSVFLVVFFGDVRSSDVCRRVGRVRRACESDRRARLGLFRRDDFRNDKFDGRARRNYGRILRRRGVRRSYDDRFGRNVFVRAARFSVGSGSGYGRRFAMESYNANLSARNASGRFVQSCRDFRFSAFVARSSPCGRHGLVWGRRYRERDDSRSARRLGLRERFRSFSRIRRGRRRRARRLDPNERVGRICFYSGIDAGLLYGSRARGALGFRRRNGSRGRLAGGRVNARRGPAARRADDSRVWAVDVSVRFARKQDDVFDGRLRGREFGDGL